jgi:hypothetical protein
VSPIEISEADLQNPVHADAIVFLLDAYSREPTANGAPLSEAVRSALVPGLRAHAGTLVLLAHEGDDAVGIAVCFLGYSTFAARSLLNVHDLAVLPPTAESMWGDDFSRPSKPRLAPGGAAR